MTMGAAVAAADQATTGPLSNRAGRVELDRSRAGATPGEVLLEKVSREARTGDRPGGVGWVHGGFDGSRLEGQDDGRLDSQPYEGDGTEDPWA